MRSWSFPLGRWFGVDIRIHAFFLLLTGPCMLGATSMNLDIWRGMVLWLLLLAVVAVREVPRLIGSAYYGLQIRNILLLPTGGLYAFANPESTERAASPKVQTPMAMIGPVSNIFFGMIVAGLIAGTSPQVSLIEFPLITPAHLMRSTVGSASFLVSSNSARLSARWGPHPARRVQALERGCPSQPRRGRNQPGACRARLRRRNRLACALAGHGRFLHLHRCTAGRSGHTLPVGGR